MTQHINIETRTMADGSARYRPNWRQDGRKMVEVFADLTRARRFAALVEAHDRRLPPVATLRAAGFDDIADKYDGPAPAPAAAPALTVADWIGRYLDTLGASTSAQTIAGYRAYLVNYIDGTDLGRTPVTRTTPDEADFAKWRNAMAAGGGRGGRPLAGSTVKRVMVGLLRPTFDMVARKGRRDPAGALPLDNPLDTVKAPTHIAPKQTRLTTDAQLGIVYRAACAVGALPGDAVLFMLATGLRWGETFGLTRDAVDLDAGTITVAKVARRARGVWTLQAKPKTRAGWRTLHIPAGIADMLAARFAAAADNADGLLFPGADGRVLQYGRWDDMWADVLAQAAALGLNRHITAHGLRRTNLTRLHLAQVPDEALAGAAGHSDVRLTLGVYVDTDDTGRALVAAAADGIVEVTRAA